MSYNHKKNYYSNYYYQYPRENKYDKYNTYERIQEQIPFVPNENFNFVK
ncbi:MAG: hypothetical protein MJ252_17195 [archaeon]|nr:hypothetical protein [archaeon]